jgi:hypothetical protein
MTASSPSPTTIGSRAVELTHQETNIFLTSPAIRPKAREN